MANSLPIQPMPEFSPDADIGASLASRWKTWLTEFEMFLTASGITDTKRQRALLLYQAGARVGEIFNQLADTGEDKGYDTAKTKLSEFFEPQKNRRYEVYCFRQATQETAETLDQFHTRLRTLSKNCEFKELDFEIEQQIIIGGKSSKIRKRALRDPKYDLAAMLLDGRRDEISKYQSKDIESKETPHAEEANQITKKREPSVPAQTRPKSSCWNCGGLFPHRGQCPAKGKTCNNCGQENHFSKVCKEKRQKGQTHNAKPTFRRGKKPVQPLSRAESSSDSESSDSDDYVYAVGTKSKSTTPKAFITVQGHKFPITVDTGASINVLDQETFSKMKGVKLERTKTKAFAYNADTPVEFIGKYEALVETKKHYTIATFYVTKGHDSGCLLSSESAQDLKLISLHLNKVTQQKKQEVQTVNIDTKDEKIRDIVNKHPEVFTGIGKFKDHCITLNVDKEVIPVAQPQRRIPYHIRGKVEKAVEKLQAQGLIEKVPADQPTDWISPIVAVPKPNDTVRLCVDMRVANTAIKRVRYLIPTVEDISLDLNGAKYFSKLDLNEAYHQLELDPESRGITTFSTHVGLYRYTRLNYGTNAAAEIFQHTLQKSLQGIKGVKNLADDIIVFGSTREEHDQALKECLSRLAGKNLTLNPGKCKFLQKSLNFFGQIFSERGTTPDPKRISALENTKKPTSAQEIRSFLGMVNYSSKYIKDYATISAPLRELTKKHVVFKWEQKHQDSFEMLKKALTSAPVMAYFDKNKESIVTVDASPVGISAILEQKSPETGTQSIIAYASRGLTDVEKRYSQTEKEGLSIVWAVEHFHLFLFGSHFTLVTDHKPLEIIYGSPRSKPSARIERWILRLQPYSFSVKYKPGSENPADYLSRYSESQPIMRQEKLTEEYVNFISRYAVPKAMTLKEIKDATDTDRTLKAVRAAIRTNQWNVDLVQPFKSIKDELTINSENVVLRGHRIVIPSALQQRAVDLAHDSHQGLVKTKALLREKVWFPGIDKIAQTTVGKCIPCQATGKANPPEPLQMTSMPEGPWDMVHIDFFGPVPTGEYLLVIIDRYSRFPEVELVKSTKTSSVIPRLDRIFSVHGIPREIKTDNGPPFNGEEFENYVKALGIKYDPGTPLWPQSNAEVERFMQPLRKALQTARLEGRVWKQDLNRFLLQYRTTPHSTTKVPPCELLFNRTVKGKLPTLLKEKVKDRHKEARDNELASQKYQKFYADKRRNAKPSNLRVGDFVLVKQEKQNKFTSRFNDTPYKIIECKGSRITAENDRHRITRNASFFKSIPIPNLPEESDSDTDSNFDYDTRANDAEKNQTIARRSVRNRRAPERYGTGIPS